MLILYGSILEIRCYSITLLFFLGMLFAVPIPFEHAFDSDVINEVIEKSLNNIPSEIQGKNITPYLLAEVAKITEGKSLQSSILFLLS